MLAAKGAALSPSELFSTLELDAPRRRRVRRSRNRVRASLFTRFAVGFPVQTRGKPGPELGLDHGRPAKKCRKCGIAYSMRRVVVSTGTRHTHSYTTYYNRNRLFAKKKFTKMNRRKTKMKRNIHVNVRTRYSYF